MHEVIIKMQARGFEPFTAVTADDWNRVEHMKKIYGEYVLDDLLTVPGSANYLPPLIPTDKEWADKAMKIVHASFLGLIADIWTQLLITKRDAKERSLYMFWDDDVPKPSRLTSLAWLLTCETWPMPNHRTTGELFPPQSLILPQSTPYGHAGVKPFGYAVGKYAPMQSRSLNSLFAESLHRGDRENMARVADYVPVYRPPAKAATGYGFHAKAEYENTYRNHRIWGRTTNRAADHGYAAYEIQESDMLHRQLNLLRRLVMRSVLIQPGMPTHRDNLHNPPGLWIRNWSEMGLVAYAHDDPSHALWTPDGDTIKLEHGATLKTIPNAAPRFWFGFTALGPTEYDPMSIRNGNNSGESASERWASAYLKYRSFATRMLFHPDLTNLNELVEEAAVARAKTLERHGRLKKSASVSTDFKAAFAKVVNNQNQE